MAKLIAAANYVLSTCQLGITPRERFVNQPFADWLADGDAELSLLPDTRYVLSGSR
jgi:hypothetical protein